MCEYGSVRCMSVPLKSVCMGYCLNTRHLLLGFLWPCFTETFTHTRYCGSKLGWVILVTKATDCILLALDFLSWFLMKFVED